MRTIDLAARATRATGAALLAALLVPAAARAQDTAQAAAVATAPADTVTLPPAREIIDRYVKAIGGREAVMKTSSSHTTGMIAVPSQGLVGEVEVFQAKPNKLVVKTNLPPIGEGMSGFDGTTAWSIDQMQGPMLLQGKQLEDAKLQADYYGRLHDAKKFKSMETVERVAFEGKPAWKVRLTRQNGEVVDELFDVDSGLMVGSIATRESPMGPLTVTSVMSDYKSFGGQLVPTKVVQKVQGQEIVVTISSVEYDTVDPTVFALPEAIQALKKN